jgi:hypothetical protein
MQVLSPNKIDKSFQMTVSIVKAQDLIKLDSLQPFVSARVNGLVLVSGVGRN